MRTGVLFSGGKDSCLALHKYGLEKVDCLLSILPENFDSFMFHKPDLKFLKKQAEMLGKDLIIEKSKGEENKELEDLRRLLEKSKVNKLVIGGIKSNYQGDRLKELCSKLDIELIIPLWGFTEEKLWRELFENKFKVIITKIASEGIDKIFLGKVIDKERLDKLKNLSKKYKFSIDFEGGDAESSVLYMPGFKKEIKIELENSYLKEKKKKFKHKTINK